MWTVRFYCWFLESCQVLGVPLTPDFSAVGLAYFAQARCEVGESRPPILPNQKVSRKHRIRSPKKLAKNWEFQKMECFFFSKVGLISASKRSIFSEGVSNWSGEKVSEPKIRGSYHWWVLKPSCYLPKNQPNKKPQKTTPQTNFPKKGHFHKPNLRNFDRKEMKFAGCFHPKPVWSRCSFCPTKFNKTWDS